MSEGPQRQALATGGLGYWIGQDSARSFGLDVNGPVFAVSAITIVAFVSGALAFQEGATHVFGAARLWLTTHLDWALMIGANAVLLFCLSLIVSPLGKVRIGGREARPEYSNPSWFAMLFAAGVGIGLMFFGVLEPVHYFRNPPLGVEPASTEAVRALGIAGAVFHWGMHGWAIYGVVALTLAFFSYNRGLPLTIRSAFQPLLGDRVWGWPGHVIDTLAVFATVFGLATSLGLGTEQTAAGLDYLFGIPATAVTKVALIALITGAALVSVLTGLDAGVKRLSQLNLLLAIALMLFIIVVGPTAEILVGAVTGLGAYLAHIVPLSNWIGREDTDFLHDWTTFYWAWWISWSPFVGAFIARISKGRTVREFMACVLLLPTLFCVLWMSTFGGTAVHQFVADGYTGVTAAVSASRPELSLFRMFEALPLAGLLSLVGIVLVIVFFVTSSDSGALVIDMIAAGGKVDTPVVQRMFWCAVVGLVAIALLLGGGLQSLQAATLTTGLPFVLVLLGMVVSIGTALRRECEAQQTAGRPVPAARVSGRSTAPASRRRPA